MVYKFIQKTELNQKTVIEDKTFNKGDTVYKVNSIEWFETKTLYLNREEVKNMIQSGVKIKGLKLDSLNRIIVDKALDFEEVAHKIIDSKLDNYLNTLDDKGRTFAFKPSLYDGDVISLSNVFDNPTYQILSSLFSHKDFDFEKLLFCMGYDDSRGLDTTCKYWLATEEPANFDWDYIYTNQFECSRAEQLLDTIAEAVRFKVKVVKSDEWYYENVYAYLYKHDILYLARDEHNTALKYIAGDVKLPPKGSMPKAYKEVIDCAYSIDLSMTGNVDKFINDYINTYWTLDDELNKHKRSLEIFKLIKDELKHEYNYEYPGANGYLNPKPYIQNIVNAVKKQGEYICNTDEHNALVSLVGSTSKKNLEYVGLHSILVKPLGIIVTFNGQENSDCWLKTSVKITNNHTKA